MTQNEDDFEVKQQSLSYTLFSITLAAVNGIVGYIAVYFFKPFWEKIVVWWNSKSNVR
jgi:hypothetical protein